jgi:hypothetical protein
MNVCEGQTLAHRFEHSSEFLHDTHRHWKLGNSYSGFTQALAKASPWLPQAIQARLQKCMLEKAGEHARVEGWLALAVDGARFETPRTEANQTGLGCAARDKSSPQVFLTTVWHLGLGLPWDFRVSAGATGERADAREMIDGLPARSLLVADAGFISYAFCRELLRKGHAFLLRVGGNLTLLRQLGYYEQEGENTVYLWPLDRRTSPPLVLRLIVLRQGKETMYLATNVLEDSELSDESARRLYELRWSEEVYHRGFKQTLSHHKLLSRTPATCLIEATWIILCVWLLGLLCIAQIPSCKSPRKWSVAKSRDAVRRAMRGVKPGKKKKATSRDLAKVLSQAIYDDYVRTKPKASRNYPRKRQRKPPGKPKIKLATESQIRQAAKLARVNVPL